MAAEGTQDDNCVELDGEAQEREKQISALLSDSKLRDSLIQKLTEGSHVVKQNTPNQKKDGIMPGGYPFGSGGWPAFLVQFPFIPFPTHPTWGASHNPPVAAGAGSSQLLHGSALGLGRHVCRARREGKKKIIWTCWTRVKPWNWSNSNLLLMMMTLGRPVTQSTTLLRRASPR